MVLFVTGDLKHCGHLACFTFTNLIKLWWLGFLWNDIWTEALSLLFLSFIMSLF